MTYHTAMDQDDAREKTFFAKRLAFSQKWFYLLASVLLVIALLLIGMTLTPSNLNAQGERYYLLDVSTT